jgi:(2Fe-2S) ferredoxin
MPQQGQGDKRGYILVCHGPSCSQTHKGALPGDVARLLPDCAVSTGGCLGMCPVGPNAIVRREPIGLTKVAGQIGASDSILCGIADPNDLARLVQQSLSESTAPRLLKGLLTPTNIRR